MLNTDKDGKDTNLKALKLVRRFIKDCGYLDRRFCPVNFLVRPLGLSSISHSWLSSLLCPYGDILPSPLPLFFHFPLILFIYLTPGALIFISFVFSFVNDGGVRRFQYGLKRGGGRHNRSTITLRVGLRLECFSC
jgi:hypothetical protein